MAVSEKQIRELVAQNIDGFIKIRRDFHRFPELGLQEFKTADKIEHYLKSWGIDNCYRINETSVVGTIMGQTDEGINVGLRADVDGLPIYELNTCEYKSQHEGVMHACGHDVHTTIALGAGFVLKHLSEQLPGHVKLLFQQAEETVGGAKTMIEAGALEAPFVHHVLGLHVCPKLSVGTFGVKYDHGYAASDTITFIVHGKSAHGAAPQDGVDAVVIAAHVVVALQTLVSRNTSPLDAAVLSFGMVSGGDAHNVIASQVKVKGTLRTLDGSVRKQLKMRLFEVANHVAKGLGGEVTLSVETGYDALVNDEIITNVVRDAASRVLGEGQVTVLKNPSMGVEDFAYFAASRPSSYGRLGVANERLNAPLHSGNFDVDEQAIEYGILIQVFSVLALMGVGIDE